MKKSVKCAVLSVLMVCVFVFSLPLTAFAADNYKMNINEPAKSDNQGYILLLVEGSSGSRQVHCISWTLMPLDVSGTSNVGSDDLSMNISVNTSTDTVSFFGYCSNNNGSIKYSCGFGRCLSGDSARTSFWSVFGLDSLDTAYTYSLGSTQNIIGYQIYGDGIQYYSDLGNNNNVPFTVSWGNDSNYSSILTQMLAQMYIDADNDATIISQLNELLGHAQTAEELLVSIEYFVEVISNNTLVIKLRTSEIRDLLKEIVNASGESTFEEPSTESISDYNKAEDELVSGAEDTSDIESQIEDFEIDAEASGKIWDIITQFFNCHPRIMGLVIGILCLGIIALILNR